MACAALPRIAMIHSNKSHVASVRDTVLRFQSTFSHIAESELSNILKIVPNWALLVVDYAHYEPSCAKIVEGLRRDYGPEVLPVCLLQDEKTRNPPDLFGANHLVTLKDFANEVASIINEMRQGWPETSHHSRILEVFTADYIQRGLPTWDERVYGRLEGDREKLRVVRKILDFTNIALKLLERSLRRLWREAERNGGI